MVSQGSVLCVCIVMFLTSPATSCGPVASQGPEEDEELSKPLQTYLPLWYRHSRGLNGRVGRVLQQQRTVEDVFYAQDEEDEAAEQKYFPNVHGGTFVELGATDGELFSNTKFFEDHRGWRGLLIDPNLLEFDKIPAKRPNAIAVNAAICAQEQLVHFVGKGAVIPLAGNSAGPLAGVWEFMAPDFKKQWFRKKAHEIPADAELVPCVSLSLILEMFGASQIDFFSLDVEGAELEVLKTINLARVNISVLVVEMDGSNSGKDDAVRKLLVANNFELDVSMKEVKAGLRNEWYVSKDFSPPKESPATCLVT